MAATVSIVVRAINATKAVFQEVNTQASSLNKSISAIGRAFKTVFVAGILAKFVKGLAEASTYSDQLADKADKIKSQWRTLAEDIGDGFAPIFAFILEEVEKIIGRVNKLIEKIRFAAAYYGALAGGATSDEAIRIADETVLAIENEQEARRQAEEDRQKRLNAAEKKQEDIARAEEQAAKDLEKLREDVAKKEEEYAEQQLSDVDLLAKKRQELEKARMTQVGFGDEKTKLEARNQEIELLKEIETIEEGIAREAEKALEEKQREEQKAKDRYIDQEQEKLDAAKERIQQTTKMELDALETQLQQSKQNEAELKSASEKIGELIVDPEKRKEAKEQLAQEIKEEKERAKILRRAEKKEKEGRRLTEVEQLAITKRELDKAAELEKQRQRAIEDEMARLQKESVNKLDSIDKQMTSLMSLKD